MTMSTIPKSLPMVLTCFGSVQTRDKMYVFGGANEKKEPTSVAFVTDLVNTASNSQSPATNDSEDDDDDNSSRSSRSSRSSATDEGEISSFRRIQDLPGKRHGCLAIPVAAATAATRGKYGGNKENDATPDNTDTGFWICCGDNDKSVAVYDAETNSYSDGPQMNHVRYLAGWGMTKDGNLLIVGGWGGTAYLKSMEVLDVNHPENGWEVFPMEMSVARDSFAMVVVDGRFVYVCGGYNDAGSWLDSVEMLDWENRELGWKMLETPISTASNALASTVLVDKDDPSQSIILLVGGLNGPIPLSSAWYMTVDTATGKFLNTEWAEVPNALESGRCYFNLSAEIDSDGNLAIAAVGGKGDGLKQLKSIEVLKLPPHLTENKNVVPASR